MKSALSQLGRRTEPPPISWLMNLALSRPQLISLAAGFTDNESLPTDFTLEIVEEVMRRPRSGQSALQYGPTPGDPELRELTARRLTDLDAACAPGRRRAYSADDVIITNGSQQLLYMISEVLCDPGDIVLVEDPTYFVYLGIAQSHGIRCRGVKLESDGIDLDHLENTLKALKKSGELKRVKMLYLVSYYQNPACLTTSLKKKRAALKLLRAYEKAAGHPLYLLEDAAYRELRFSGEDTPSALIDRNSRDRLLYTSTYSKPFATGIRAGFGVLPKDIMEIVARVKGNHDFGTANLVQRVLVRAIQSGRYEMHLVQLRKRYAKKAGIMERAMRKHFPESIEWPETRGGLYYWASTPKHAKTGTKSKVFNTALANDVIYVPGSLCYADDPTRRKPDNEMRISFGSAKEKNIRDGIRSLGEVLRAHC
ncbi:MAG: GntR family transcriptional regulator [Verrucomicrobiales bacterium]|nr:GntR family transcriptional regulator [Verrucomicrobiales bacterium]|tara:strand:- start:723 stop:1997 length:1275 start_codon:yes stop_codon:yes gene_type:complete